MPIVTVVCAAGDLNGSARDHWDTHGNNFVRLKRDLLPPYDRAVSALLGDLSTRGRLDSTLVVTERAVRYRISRAVFVDDWQIGVAWAWAR